MSVLLTVNIVSHNRVRLSQTKNLSTVQSMYVLRDGGGIQT